MLKSAQRFFADVDNKDENIIMRFFRGIERYCTYCRADYSVVETIWPPDRLTIIEFRVKMVVEILLKHTIQRVFEDRIYEMWRSMAL